MVRRVKILKIYINYLKKNSEVRTYKSYEKSCVCNGTAVAQEVARVVS